MTVITPGSLTKVVDSVTVPAGATNFVLAEFEFPSASADFVYQVQMSEAPHNVGSLLLTASGSVDRVNYFGPVNNSGVYLSNTSVELSGEIRGLYQSFQFLISNPDTIDHVLNVWVLGSPSASAGPVAPAPVTLYTESPTARTSSGASNAFTWPSGVSQVFVGVNVTAFARAPHDALTVTLQQEDANGVFQDIGSSAEINETGTTVFSVGTGLDNGQMIVAGGTYRFLWTVAGSPSALSFQVGITGR